MPSVNVAQQLGTGAFWMGHHAKNISLFIANCGDISQGPVRIARLVHFTYMVTIAINNLVTGFQLVQRPFIGVIPSFAMCDRDFHHLVKAIVTEINVFTYKLLIRIPQQNAGQQMGLAENLESIANTKYKAALTCKLNYALHHRAKSRDGATAQIITI